MEPFLRPATDFGRAAKPTPVGWADQPIGAWRSRAVEVVYDPRRHDIAVIRPTAPVLTAALANLGWRRRGCDGGHEWWVRDRVAAAQRRLARHEPTDTVRALGR